ncbi:MAG: Wzz/FepE/Etk N-terminal domain-containing protein [Armatimonadota bacterium]|nr:Wzz/FepE/Etk N-terminal domain-containing protein [Armatimonadota bacterium]
MFDPSAAADNEIDLRQYLRILHKRRWVIALATAVAVATSGVFSFFVLPPVYEARATLMMMNATQVVTPRAVQNNSGLEGVVNDVSRLPQMTLNTYVNQLTSQTLRARTGQAMVREGTIESLQQLAGIGVRAQAVRDTNLVELTVSGTDAALATRFANALSREFVKHVSESNQALLDRSVQSLEEQLRVVDRNLGEARRKLAEIESRPRGVDFLASQVQTRRDDLSRYETQARQVQVDIRLLGAGLASAEQALARTPREIAAPSPDGVGGQPELNPAWTALTQLAESKRVELAQKEAEAAALDQMIASLEDELGALQGELTAQRSERDRLQIDVDRLARTRDLLATKITETRITRSLDLGQMNIDVVSPALQPSSPVKPNKSMNLILAAVLGLMSGVFLAFLFEMLDNTLKTAEDVERELGLPVLGTIPSMSPADLRT